MSRSNPEEQRPDPCLMPNPMQTGKSPSLPRLTRLLDGRSLLGRGRRRLLCRLPRRTLCEVLLVALALGRCGKC